MQVSCQSYCVGLCTVCDLFGLQLGIAMGVVVGTCDSGGSGMSLAGGCGQRLQVCWQVLQDLSITHPTTS